MKKVDEHYQMTVNVNKIGTYKIEKNKYMTKDIKFNIIPGEVNSNLSFCYLEEYDSSLNISIGKELKYNCFLKDDYGNEININTFKENSIYDFSCNIEIIFPSSITYINIPTDQTNYYSCSFIINDTGVFKMNSYLTKKGTSTRFRINSKNIYYVYNSTSNILYILDSNYSLIVDSSFSLTSDSSSSLAISNILDSSSSTLTSENIIKTEKEIQNELKLISIKTNKTKEQIIQNKNINEIIENYDNRKNYKIYGNNYIININIIDSQKFENSSTYIDFSSCENKLRTFYNINEDKILILFKMEINKNNSQSLINQVEYAIFDENNKMLDLSICSKEEIKIYYNIINSSVLNSSYISYFKNLGIDVFNINDRFFNDICYPYSEHGSDMILRDRIKYYFQNYSLCDFNCEYEYIDIENMRILCNCQVKTRINTEIEEPTYNKIILDVFKDTQIWVIKCYKLVFNLNKKNNIGFWIFLILISIHLPFIINYIIFKDKLLKIYIKEKIIIFKNFKIFNPLKKKNLEKGKEIYKKNYILGMKYLKDINYKSYGKLNDSSITRRRINNNISLKNNSNSLKSNENINIIITNDNNDSFRINKNKKKKIMKDILNLNYLNDYFTLNKYNVKFNTLANFNNNMNFELINMTQNNYNNTYPDLNFKFKNVHSLFFALKKNNNNIKTINNNYKNAINKFLLDSNLYYDNYQEAIKYEKRNFIKIFYSMLKLKVKLIKIFFYKSKIELKCIYIILVIFTYSCNFFLNSLFYFSDKISDKYHYKGNDIYKFTLVNNISICLISTFISTFIVSLFTFLANSKKEILNVFKTEKKFKPIEIKNKHRNIKNNKTLSKFTNILSKLRRKIISFIIIEFIIFLFFFYFTTAFCEVYIKTQKTWIMDCFTSFLTSIFIEIGIACIIAILYISSYKYKKRFLYQIMKLLL